ncbi:hypothetical protein KAX35_08480 [candidate division WOR-3 bacterium]|nr:hypothetical protein [candidate division WOR-3 bacterium]
MGSKGPRSWDIGGETRNVTRNKKLEAGKRQNELRVSKYRALIRASTTIN